MRRPPRPPRHSSPCCCMRLIPTPALAPALLFTLALGGLPVAAAAQSQPDGVQQSGPAGPSGPSDTTDTTDATAKADKADTAYTADPPADYWRLMGSPYTLHYRKDEEGVHEYVYMVGLERQRSDGWVWGGVYFSNSFGQPSGYVYVGEKVIGFSRWDKLFFQWTAGLLYGYKDPYEHKVPFNHNGFSPGATVSLGWQFTRQFSMQAIALGTAGVMFQMAWDLR